MGECANIDKRKQKPALGAAYGPTLEIRDFKALDRARLVTDIVPHDCMSNKILTSTLSSLF